MEFNGFIGAPAYCLPRTLELAGYQAIAPNTYNPSFFNAPNAYQGTGFAITYFPKEYVSSSDTYHLSKVDTSGEMRYMFCSTLVFPEPGVYRSFS